MAYDVAISACRDYFPGNIKSAMDAALDAVGGLGWVTPGMRVVIKPNLCAASAPEEAVTTHPALLCDLTERLIALGAEVTIGESPGGFYSQAVLTRLYAATGMTACEALGARLNLDVGASEVSCPEGSVIKRITHTSYLDDADAIITFAKLKTHGMMGMTAAAKNLFGTIPGTLKFEYHYRFPNHRDFANMLVDVCECHKPRLALIDAVVGMEGNGPTAGTPRQMGFLIASASPHAADLVAAHLLGIPSVNVPTLGAAIERGLIPEGVSGLRVWGDMESLRVPDCKFIPQVGIENVRNMGNALAAVVRALIRRRPRVDGGSCVGCGACMRLCPAKAIVMRDKLPVIDRKACIRCFCCQEFCPEGAMQVHRPLIARLLAPEGRKN